MKDLKQLIAEDKKEFDEAFPRKDYPFYNGRFNPDEEISQYNHSLEQIKSWHTTSLKSLLLALRERIDERQKKYDPEIREPQILIDPSAVDGYNLCVSDISTLITEVINSLEE